VCAIHISSCFSRCLRVPIAMPRFYKTSLWIPQHFLCTNPNLHHGLLGHWLEMRAISQARGALNALAALLPDTAERVSGAETQTIPLSQLHLGDIVLVRPGTRVPADGAVVEGAADVD